MPSFVASGSIHGLRSPLHRVRSPEVRYCTQDSGSWRAENGSWHLPGGGQDSLASPRSQCHEGSTFVDAGEVEDCGAPDDEGVKLVTEVMPVRLRRGRTIRLGSDLERGVWMWLIVIGAIVLIAVSYTHLTLPTKR